MTKVKYELHVRAKRADGPLRAFDLVVLEPVPHPEFGWQCEIYCEMLRGKPMRAYGDDERVAWAMALVLVTRLLGYAGLTLVDENGKSVELPKLETGE